MQAMQNKNPKRSQDSLPNANGSHAMMSNPSNPATLLTGSQPDLGATNDSGYNPYATAQDSAPKPREKKKILTDFERHMGWMQDVRAAKRNMI